VQDKADAKLTVTELIRKKHAALTNHEYLDKAFDFYGMSFRLQGHEKTKLAKGLVITHLSHENATLKEQTEQLRQEIDAIQMILEAAQDSELDAKTKYQAVVFERD